MNSQELWRSYHTAVAQGKIELAKKILRSLQSYKANPPPRRGGCASCKKRFY